MNNQAKDYGTHLSKADLPALAALGLLFALMLLASWQGWTQPLLDHGREMHLPARLLTGEQLYTDVQFLYGPFAPYFNALLYRLFGVHLAVLHVSGVFCAALILALIYWLSRQVLAVWPAAATAGLVLVVCALKSTANYVQPYAYAALYGLVFALLSLLWAVRFVQTRRVHQLGWAGLFAGLALLCKPELALPALAAAGAAWLLECLWQGRVAWRASVVLALAVLALPVAVYSALLARVPWRVLLRDNHVLFTNMPPQLVYFNRHISGLAQWPDSLWFSLAGLGVLAVWIGGSGLLAALLSGRLSGWQALAQRCGLLLAAGMLWRALALRVFGVPSDVTPFAAAVFVLPLLLAEFWSNPTNVASLPAAATGSKPPKPLPGSCTLKRVPRSLSHAGFTPPQPASPRGSWSSRLSTMVLYFSQLLARLLSSTVSQTIPDTRTGAAMCLVNH